MSAGPSVLPAWPCTAVSWFCLAACGNEQVTCPEPFQFLFCEERKLSGGDVKNKYWLGVEGGYLITSISFMLDVWRLLSCPVTQRIK